MLSLSQAGCMCVCRSQAWDAKIVTSAWWVHSEQVRTFCVSPNHWLATMEALMLPAAIFTLQYIPSQLLA